MGGPTPSTIVAIEFAVRFSEFVSEIGLEDGSRSGGGWKDRACEVNTGSSISEDDDISYSKFPVISWLQQERINTRESDRNPASGRIKGSLTM